jgi:hypothetical protein
MRWIHGAPIVFSVFLFASFLPTMTRGQAPPPAGTGAGSLLNPNISVVGWAQAEAGDEDDVSQAFSFREAEIGFQAVVDPHLRADYFIAISPEEGVHLEEGYLTFLSLPKRLGLKAGIFRSNFGKFNRTHPPETPFADRPLAAEALFGEEGLSPVGASLSYLIPNPFGIYLNLDLEATNTPEGHEVAEEEEDLGEEPPVFEPAGPYDLLYLGRLGTFLELGEPTNLTLGASYANGSAGDVERTEDAVETRRSQIIGADVTLRWKNPRRAIYRSFTWLSEGYVFVPDEPDDTGSKSRRGVFTSLNYQFARRWQAGVRGDWIETSSEREHEAGALAYLTFTPSEFSLLSLQGRGVRLADGSTENRLFFKLTANIGPHGVHPF